MKYEIKYIGECEHLENFTHKVYHRCCKKRYYTVFDPQIGDTYRIAFCNDALKLHMQQEFAHKMIYYSNQCKHEIESLIVRALNLQAHHYLISKTHPVINNVWITLCERPRTYIQVPFKTCIEWYLNNRSFELWEMMKHPLNDFIREKRQYKKYQSLCEKLQHMIKQVPKKYMEDVEPLINDILLLILKIIYNETNQQQVTTALHIRYDGETRPAKRIGRRSKSTGTLSEAS
jgi:hypothetical protein